MHLFGIDVGAATDEKNARNRASNLVEPAKQGEAIHDGHVQVRYKQIDRSRLEDSKRDLSIFSSLDTTASGSQQQLPKDVAKGRFVINNQNVYPSQG